MDTVLLMVRPLSAMRLDRKKPESLSSMARMFSLDCAPNRSSKRNTELSGFTRCNKHKTI